MTQNLALGRRDRQTAVITTSDSLRALKPAWDGLYERCGSATPFQSHTWVTSWWEQYGSGRDLRVVVLRSDDRLLAALPLVRSHRWGCRVLSPLGVGLSDFTDLLVDDEHAASLMPAACQALLRLPGWDVLDFPEVRPGAALEELAGQWSGRRWRMGASHCLRMPAVPLEDQIAAIGGRAAGKLRRNLRKIDNLELHAGPVSRDRVPAVMADLLRLHALQWEGRAINKEHLRPRFQRHLIQSATELIGAEQAVLTEFRIGDRLVAADFTFIGKDFAGGYLYGADPWLRTRADTFAMVVRHALRQAHERGLQSVSMLRGAEPHKAKWGAQAVQNQRMIFGRTRRATAYTAVISARTRAVRTIKENFPNLGGSVPLKALP